MMPMEFQAPVRQDARLTPPDVERGTPALGDAAWANVRVQRVEVDLGRPRPVPPGQRRVRVDVELGALTPADVRVTLARRGEGTDEPVEPMQLWCAHTYHNGVYAFEAHVPLEVLREPGVAVEVEPAEGRETRAPVRRAMTPEWLRGEVQ